MNPYLTNEDLMKGDKYLRKKMDRIIKPIMDKLAKPRPKYMVKDKKEPVWRS